jgi:hypothetical protein
MKAPPEAENPDLKARKEREGKKSKFMADLRRPKAASAKPASMGPASEAAQPGTGHDVQDALRKLDEGPRSLTRWLDSISSKAVGGFFAQAAPEKLTGCLNALGSASEAERRELIPKFLDAMARTRPPCRLSKEVLGRLEDSALRGLATHAADASAGSQALVSSGLLGELVQRAQDHPKNSMAAMEGLSRLCPPALPQAMKELGLSQETLTGWVREATATDPMSAKGGWVNPETVQRLADKLAQQPGGAGLSAAAGLISTTLAAKAERGLQPDARLQMSLETVLQHAQNEAVPASAKAAVTASVADSGIFSHPEVLTPPVRSSMTSLIASARTEFTDLYVNSDRDRGLELTEIDRLSEMVKALGFTGPEAERRNFNSMWGNLVGASLREAVDQNNGVLARKAGMLFGVYAEGLKAKQGEDEAKVKALQDLLGFAVSGIGGGFSWRLGAYNLVNPLKEGGKGLMNELAKSLAGKPMDAGRVARQIQDHLLKDAGRYADTKELDDKQWSHLTDKFEGGRDHGRIDR